MNTRVLVRAILAAAALASFNAAAADLKEVYTRALTNDPLIREAEANRLATRESKPQAIAALLPQIAANASQLKNESTGSQTVIDINEDNGDVTVGSAERETKGLEIASAAVLAGAPRLHSDDRVEEALAVLPESEEGLA